MNAIALLCVLLQDQEPPKPTPAELQAPPKEVVIIGQRRESDILDVPSAVTLITSDQIKESGATNIVEVVQRAPGFFVQGSNKGAYDAIVDLRGFNNGGGNGQRTLVLVDGRKTNSVSGSATDWSAIPLENIERVEIVRGPAAALYGDGAMAGVVNIITRKGGKGATSHVTTSGGNWGTYRGAANVAQGNDDVNFDFLGSLDRTDGWRDNSAYHGTDATARLDFPLAAAVRSFLKLGMHDDTRERPGTLSKAEVATLGRTATTTPGDEGEREEIYVDGGVTWSLQDLGEVSVFVNHTRSVGTSFFAAFGGFEIEDDSEISMLQLKHVVTPEVFSRAAVFTTGADFSYELAEAESGSTGFPPTESDYRRRLAGVYEHVEVRPLAPLILTTSLRYDRALLDLDRDIPPGGFGADVDRERAFDQFSPHAGLTYKVVEEASLYGSWGRTFKYPTRDELIGFVTTSPEVDPERSQVYEAGARFWSGRWGSAGVSAFYMRVDDEIFFDPATFENYNFDEVVHRGVEAEVRARPLEWIEVFATGTYTRAIIEKEDVSGTGAYEGKDFPVTPRRSGTAGLVVRQWGATLTLDGRYAGDRYLINDVSNSSERFDPYLIYNGRIAYAWETLTAFVAVYNITDREYYDSGGLGFAGPEYNPAPERSWLLGGELRF